VIGFQFRDEFLLLQLNCDLLVGGEDRAYSFREIAKMLHNVYKTFDRRFAVDQNHISFLQVGESHL
jgi:hypothetical protein